LIIGLKVEVLGEDCFSERKSLQSVIFEEGSKLMRIEDCAFFNCSGLKSICIPASVESLGDCCFGSCTTLSKVTFEPGSKLVRIEKGAFAGCLSLSSICIPAQIQILVTKCFAACRSLATLTFERQSKLKQIDHEAFDECRALRRLVFQIPSHLKQLDLPPSDFGLLWIPDSVRVVTGSMRILDVHNRILRFGRESRLVKIHLTRYVQKLGNARPVSVKALRSATFVHLSEEILRRFRAKLKA
jgi:hypothetical protein